MEDNPFIFPIVPFLFPGCYTPVLSGEGSEFDGNGWLLMDQATARAVLADDKPQDLAVPGFLILCLSNSLVPSDAIVSFSSVCVDCWCPNSAWEYPVLCLFKTVGSER